MLPSSFHDQVAYTEVLPETWRIVLDSSGEGARLSGIEITPARLSESLTQDSPGKELLDALEVILELGTDSGRESEVQAGYIEGGARVCR